MHLDNPECSELIIYDCEYEIVYFIPRAAIMLSKGWSIIASYCVKFIPVSIALKFS